MDLSEKIAEDSLPLTVVALLGRAVGMMVPLVIARWFGADANSDAFYLALTVPMFVDALLATALHGTLGSLYAKTRAKGPLASAQFLGASLFIVVFLLSFVALALGFILPPTFHALAAERAELATQMLTPLLIAIPLIGANVTLGTSLELRGHFLIPAWLPAIKAGAYLTVAGLLKEEYAILSLPIGYVLGEVGQLLWLSLNLWRKGVPIALPRRASLSTVSAGIAFFVPVALGDLAVHINALVDRLMAAPLGPGELTALEYADRARVIPEAVVGAGLLRVAFAYWANAQAAGNTKSIRDSFAKVAGWIWILLVPAVAALLLLRLPVISILYGGAAFDEAAVAETARTFMGYLPGVPLLMLGALALQLLWIRGEVKLVALIGILSTFSNFGLNALLSRSWGPLGLSASTSINQGLVAVIFLWVLHRRIPGLLNNKHLMEAIGFLAVVVGTGLGMQGLFGHISADILKDLPKILCVSGGMGALIVAGLWLKRDLNAVLKLDLGQGDGDNKEDDIPPRNPGF